MEIKIKRKAKSAVICDEIEIDKRDPQVRETNSPNGHAMSGRVVCRGKAGGRYYNHSSQEGKWKF